MKSYSVRPTISDSSRSALSPYPDLLAHMLYHRGITDAESADRFLNPDYDRDTHDPYLLKGIDVATERIDRAFANEEKTVIYSDYDTDGIPAGVALHDFFKKVGFKNFTNYIPHRHDEGFGLNADAIEQFAKDGVRLLITIDCGIADVEHVALARKKGIDVIITDHHLPGDVLPPAYAILNPKQAGCNYPEKMLCGAGVIYKLIQAMIKKGGKTMPKSGWEKWLLDMIGIATLSDMVPLTGENRAFAYYGLTVLRKSPRVGLVKLLSKLKVNQRHLVEEDIGFTIGPRINAASRMGVPMDAFRLLATDDEIEAGTLADHLNTINDERKTIVAGLVKEVKHVIRERYNNTPKGIIVAGNPLWKPSLLGLAANTCAQEYNCPVFLWGRDGDNIIKGSCRSDGVTNLVEMMSLIPVEAKILEQYGGHSQSGGFVVSDAGVHHLEEHLCEALKKIKTAREKAEGEKSTNGEISGGESENKSESGKDYVDAVLSLEHVSWSTYALVEKLGPYGTGNPKPLFMFKNISPTVVKVFGKQKNHLELIFGKISAIGFFREEGELKSGDTITLIATFEKSMFRGRPELRLRIVDIL